MKKSNPIIAFIILLFSCLSLAACGGSSGSPWKGIQAGMKDLSVITDRTEYYDIFAEQEPIFQWEPDKENSPLSTEGMRFIGMQFYQGEPVQIWRKTVQIWEGTDSYSYVWDIYLYRQDGSREVLLSNFAIAGSCPGYLDKDGNLYMWHNSETVPYLSDDRTTIIRTEEINTSLMKYDPSGKLLFEKEYSYGYDIDEMRQTENGRMYLIVRDKEADSRRLAELNPANGLIKELSIGQLADNTLSTLQLGIYENQPAAYKSQTFDYEITEINVKKGTESCFFSFQGTSYIPPTGYRVRDFRILKDGSVEILWAASDGSKSLWEKLRMAKVERTPIVLRGVNVNAWFTTQINRFNQSNEKYHVIVEDCGSKNDVDDFARLTSVQIASGKGPDILYGSLMDDYISGLIEKGLLEDLRPYMEKSGIREDDYFPYTFNTWRDGDRICGISPKTPGLSGYRMDSTALGGTDVPDIETLVGILLTQAGQEDAVFVENRDSQDLLELLLKGSDTLWEMVDWEKGSCDFSGELFAKILETAKRYGDNKDKGEVSYIAENRSLSLSEIYLFDDRAEREKKGKVICGVLFDDGCHVAATSTSTLAINANSPNKEGAWEFLSFLLGDEAQSANSSVPASRKAYDAWVARAKEKFADGKKIDMTYADRLPDGSLVTTGHVIYTAADVTEEIIEEFTEMLEDARTYPLRTVPILDIISEEAADYFNGSKSAAEVARLVANRVQTYLDEGH